MKPDLIITIVGAQGAGKSIIAERLACLLADEGNTVRMIDGESQVREIRDERFCRPRAIEIRTEYPVERWERLVDKETGREVIVVRAPRPEDGPSLRNAQDDRLVGTGAKGGGSSGSVAMAEALWKTMRERDMTMEDALDVCAMIMMGVGKNAPASNEELVCRIEDKLGRLRPEEAR